METKDIISLAALILSIAALALSIWNSITLSRHNKRMSGFASAGSEITILAAINTARLKVHDLMVKIIETRNGRSPSKVSADETRLLIDLNNVYESTLEVLLNSYELACRLYLANKLDKASFKGQYAEEIRKLFVSEIDYYKERLIPITSPYKAMRKVYDEWTNHD